MVPNLLLPTDHQLVLLFGFVNKLGWFVGDVARASNKNNTSITTTCAQKNIKEKHFKHMHTHTFIYINPTPPNRSKQTKMMPPMASTSTFCSFQCQSCIAVPQRCAAASALPPGNSRSPRSPPRMAWPLVGLSTVAVGLTRRCRAKDAKVLRVTADEPNDKAKVSLEEVGKLQHCRCLVFFGMWGMWVMWVMWVMVYVREQFFFGAAAGRKWLYNAKFQDQWTSHPPQTWLVAEI